MSQDHLTHVLIIDDDAALTEMYATYLEYKGGMQVTAVHNAADGLEITRNTKFDVIICDYHLPDIYGTSLIRLLIRRAWSHKCPIILLTGYNLTNERMLVMPHKILYKPVLPSEMFKVIQEVTGTASCSQLTECTQKSEP